jgi:biopolymer transport protein ExbD
MSRRHRKKRGNNSVELNLAAMLDMAFQMLAFFVLTFKPAPTEGQLSMNLPPPVAVTEVQAQDQENPGGTGSGSEENTLNIFITANDRGDADLVKIGLRPISKGMLNKVALRTLGDELKQMFGDALIPFDRIQLAVAPGLRYDELMKIVDVCTKQKLPSGEMLQRISFVEIPEGTAP